MPHDATKEPGYMMWRLLADQRFQGRGSGRAAVRFVAEYVRGRPGALTVEVGARRGAGSPRAFYESLGFLPTGVQSTATKPSSSGTATTSRTLLNNACRAGL